MLRYAFQQIGEGLNLRTIHRFIVTHNLSFVACVKKGLEPEQCIDGCRTCRLAKLICDGKKPCSNCIDSQKECQGMFEATSEVWEDNVTVLAPAELRQSERAKLACLACRRSLVSFALKFPTLLIGRLETTRNATTSVLASAV